MNNKKKFYLVLDVETAHSTEDALVYDLGYAVCDKKGNIYEADSFVVSDIFYKEAELMKSAYYAEKIPKYLEGIKNRAFNVVTFYQARERLLKAMKKYNVEVLKDAAKRLLFDMSDNEYETTSSHMAQRYSVFGIWLAS